MRADWEVPCPQCEAGAGEPCVNLLGLSQLAPHTLRVDALQRRNRERWAEGRDTPTPPAAEQTPEEREAIRAAIASVRANIARRGRSRWSYGNGHGWRKHETE